MTFHWGGCKFSKLSKLIWLSKSPCKAANSCSGVFSTCSLPWGCKNNNTRDSYDIHSNTLQNTKLNIDLNKLLYIYTFELKNPLFKEQLKFIPIHMAYLLVRFESHEWVLWMQNARLVYSVVSQISLMICFVCLFNCFY